MFCLFVANVLFMDVAGISLYLAHTAGLNP
jgi:hypothetical protein